MIPSKVIQYLQDNAVPYTHFPHERAVSAQELAHVVHRTGRTVAKTLVIEADGKKALAVLPAPERVDLARAALLLGASSARALGEEELKGLFPDCELGAEPPFGRLYGLKTLLDQSLGAEKTVLIRAGAHDEALEIDMADFKRLENPAQGSFGEGH